MVLTQLINEIRKYGEGDIALVRKAYNFAREIHKGEKRVNGEDFIIHLEQTALVLAELGLDEKTIVAGLLHDSVEDGKVTLDEIKKEFGEEISFLVDSVTNVSKIEIRDYNKNQAEKIRKMLLSASKDLRVVMIKLAERLHNMKTLGAFNADKQRRIAQVTLDIYAPLAYRFGLSKIKSELEDLSFKILDPDIYQSIKKQVVKKKKVRENYLKKIRSVVEEKLEEKGLDFEISGRPKNFYSIYKKMLKKSASFDQIYDKLALRILTNKVEDCYTILGVIHSLWKPFPKFFDYIANPKPNLYQSLHTTVIGPGKELIEFQIRTREMHKIAEEGIAAHWLYKGIKGDEEFDRKLSWLKQVFNFGEKQGKGFLNALKLDLFGDNIFVFTPKGDIIELLEGSTIVDFAYAVHSNLGDRCTGGKVNGKFVNLRHELDNGDVIEIITSKIQKPSRDWLKFVKTPKAKAKIKEAIRINQNIPVKAISFLDNNIKKSGSLILTDIKDPIIKIAKCCDPLPGDKISGFVSRSNKILIHKYDCSKIKNITKKKVNADWNDHLDFPVRLDIIAIDRVGLFAEVLNIIASKGISVKKANINSVSGNITEFNALLEKASLEEIRNLIKIINKIADVKKVRVS